MQISVFQEFKDKKYMKNIFYRYDVISYVLEKHKKVKSVLLFHDVSFQAGLSVISFLPRSSIKGCHSHPSRGIGISQRR